ncbi:hypothetical protein C1X64_08105 [Pseudomonas sp. GW456-E7]|nr:hypothetical protein C1X64_08105 [Pseudomonas sp. GW456-E7]
MIEIVTPGAQPVGAGLLAKAFAQPTLMYQTNRFREQARSHRGYCGARSIAFFFRGAQIVVKIM